MLLGRVIRKRVLKVVLSHGRTCAQFLVCKRTGVDQLIWMALEDG